VSVTITLVTTSMLPGVSAPWTSMSFSTIANHSSDKKACFGTQVLRVAARPDRRLAIVAPRITRADVEHVARLARLALAEDEVERLIVDLGGILEHAEDLAALDLDGVPPTAHPLPLQNVFRPDVVGPSLDRDEVLAEAPAAEDGRFRVPRILDAP
jgi:aspartyl-tRNA(Asn)/glutamyl-tRNA(Gln) amidotransferase subunit C